MSYVALGLVAACDLTIANAQEAKPGATSLPPVYVAPTAPRPRRAQAKPSAASRAARARTPAQTAPERQPIVDSQDARSGTVGYITQQTSSATKTNTLVLNIPQSVTILTKQFIADQNFQSVSDAIRGSALARHGKRNLSPISISTSVILRSVHIKVRRSS